MLYAYASFAGKFDDACLLGGRRIEEWFHGPERLSLLKTLKDKESLDAEGKGVSSWKLAKKKFPQPEGICFLPDGDMFISTEGLSKPARLYRFAYQGTASTARVIQIEGTAA